MSNSFGGVSAYNFYARSKQNALAPNRGLQLDVTAESDGQMICGRMLDSTVTAGGSGITIAPNSIDPGMLQGHAFVAPTYQAGSFSAAIQDDVHGLIKTIVATVTLTNIPPAAVQVAWYFRTNGSNVWTPYAETTVNPATSEQSLSFGYGQLSNGVSYDFGASYVDILGETGATSAFATAYVPSNSGVSIPSGYMRGASGYVPSITTPNPAYSVELSPNGTSSSMTVTFTITNQPQDGSLSRIGLWYRQAGTTPWSFYGSLAAIGVGQLSPPATGDYSFTYADLTNGQGYDFGVSAEDAAGEDTPVVEITSAVAQAVNIPSSSFPSFPDGLNILVNGSVLNYTQEGISYTATAQFSINVTPTTPALSTWLAGINLLVKQVESTVSDGDADPSHYRVVGSIDGTTFVNPITQDFGPLQAYYSQLAIQLVDQTGNASPAVPFVVAQSLIMYGNVIMDPTFDFIALNGGLVANTASYWGRQGSTNGALWKRTALGGANGFCVFGHSDGGDPYGVGSGGNALIYSVAMTLPAGNYAVSALLGTLGVDHVTFSGSARPTLYLARANSDGTPGTALTPSASYVWPSTIPNTGQQAGKIGFNVPANTPVVVVFSNNSAVIANSSGSASGSNGYVIGNMVLVDGTVRGLPSIRGPAVNEDGTIAHSAQSRSVQSVISTTLTDGSNLAPQTVGRAHLLGAQGGNLLFNPTAASSLTGWTQFDGGAAIQCRSLALGGGSFWLVYAGTSSVDSVLYQNLSGLLFNSPYTVSGMVHVDTLASGGFVTVEAIQNGGLGNSPTITAPNAGSEFFSFTFTAPVNGDAQIRMHVNNGGTGNISAYFTKLKVEQGTVATPYTDDQSGNLTTQTHTPEGTLNVNLANPSTQMPYVSHAPAITGAIGSNGVVQYGANSAGVQIALNSAGTLTGPGASRFSTSTTSDQAPTGGASVTQGVSLIVPSSGTWYIEGNWVVNGANVQMTVAFVGSVASAVTTIGEQGLGQLAAVVVGGSAVTTGGTISMNFTASPYGSGDLVLGQGYMVLRAFRIS